MTALKPALTRTVVIDGETHELSNTRVIRERDDQTTRVVKITIEGEYILKESVT